jgi:A118 family predicted phage portal protein
MTVDTFLKEILNIRDTSAIIEPRSLINTWHQWYKGYVPAVHTVNVQAEKSGRRNIRSRTLGYAQRVCEDWGGFVISNKTAILTENDVVKELLVGNDNAGNNGVFGDNDFWSRAASAIELGFATGTCVAVVRTTSSGSIKIDFVPIESFYPLSWVDGRVTECLILTNDVKSGKKINYFTTHRLNEDGHYVITNTNFDNNSQPIEKTVYETRSDIPLFAIFSPNKGNNTQYEHMAYGVSILSGREGVLGVIDSLFNMMCGDTEVGGLKVLMTKSAMMVHGDGDPYLNTAIDVQARQLMTSFGLASDDAQIFKEFNPSLQFDTQVATLEKYLAILGQQVGLGSEKYSFSRGAQTTATAMKVSSTDQTREISKHRLKAESFICGIIDAIIYFDYAIKNEFTTLNALRDNHKFRVRVNFDDSIFTDSVEDMKLDVDLVRNGLMSKRSFVVKHGLATDEGVDNYLDEIREDQGMVLEGYS